VILLRFRSSFAPSQTGSTSGRATTPGASLPRGRSPDRLVWRGQSGLRESVASGACAEAARPPPTYLTAPPTLPVLHRNVRANRDRRVLRQAAPGAFFPGAAPGPGWRWSKQPGPRGRWSPMASARIGAHRTTDLPRNDSGPGAVTIEQANARSRVDRPARGVRASAINGPGVLPAGAVRRARNSKSAWRPAAVTSAHRPCQVLHMLWRSNGGPRGLPRLTLDPPNPPSVATRKHGPWSPSPGHARGRLQVRAGGSRGGRHTGAASTGGPDAR
jgi:hypothetical protein